MYDVLIHIPIVIDYFEGAEHVENNFEAIGDVLEPTGGSKIKKCCNF